MQETLEKIVAWLEASGRVFPEEAQDLLEGVKENLSYDLELLAFMGSALQEISTDDDFEFGSALVYLGLALKGVISTLEDIEQARVLVTAAEIPDDALPEGPVSKIEHLYRNRHSD